jgi:hypothetical protein
MRPLLVSKGARLLIVGVLVAGYAFTAQELYFDKLLPANYLNDDGSLSTLGYFVLVVSFLLLVYLISRIRVKRT